MSTRTMCKLLAVACLVGAAAASAQSLRDPTRPATLGRSPEVVYSANAPLRLEAILRAGDSRRAIVNGRVVRVGQRVGEAVITEISADSIRYTRHGREQVAALPERKISVRKPSALHAGEP